MAKKIKRRSQPKLGNGIRREQLPSCVVSEILRAVEKDATKHAVSRSWVTALILAKHYKIEIPVY